MRFTIRYESATASGEWMTAATDDADALRRFDEEFSHYDPIPSRWIVQRWSIG